MSTRCLPAPPAVNDKVKQLTALGFSASAAESALRAAAGDVHVAIDILVSVKQLTALGFSESAAEGALRAAAGDVQVAIDILISHTAGASTNSAKTATKST